MPHSLTARANGYLYRGGRPPLPTWSLALIGAQGPADPWMLLMPASCLRRSAIWPSNFQFRLGPTDRSITAHDEDNSLHTPSQLLRYTRAVIYFAASTRSIELSQSLWVRDPHAHRHNSSAGSNAPWLEIQAIAVDRSVHLSQ